MTRFKIMGFIFITTIIMSLLAAILFSLPLHEIIAFVALIMAIDNQVLEGIRVARERAEDKAVIETLERLAKQVKEDK